MQQRRITCLNATVSISKTKNNTNRRQFINQKFLIENPDKQKQKKEKEIKSKKKREKCINETTIFFIKKFYEINFLSQLLNKDQKQIFSIKIVQLCGILFGLSS